MTKFYLLICILLNCTLTPALALKPCGDTTWFANPKRPQKEWREQAALIFTGKITDVKKIVVPFVNCYEKDQSKCAMDDRSEIKVEVKSTEKGSKRDGKILNLVSAFCAPAPPTGKDVVYRFYFGGEAEAVKSESESLRFIYFEKL